MNKAAVAIGVNKTQDNTLKVLKSAASGAKEVALWLKNEGYDVECLTDDVDKVTSSEVFRAISKFASLPTKYDLLVVYFSGHGYWHSRADYWLLSDAPNNPNESINLLSSMDLAKYSGIPSIVFISDACRSIPINRSGHLFAGSAAFPNHPEINAASKIDVFKATSESLPAYEILLEGVPRSVLTHALITAYKTPTSDIVKELETNEGTIRVVTNRKLESYLQLKVNDLLRSISFTLVQRLEINVPSGDDTYIAQIHVENEDINEPVLTKSPSSKSEDNETLLRVRSMIPDSNEDQFESGTGFVVSGATVSDAACTNGDAGARVEVLDKGSLEGTQAKVSVWDVQPAVSVILELADGRSVILACIGGYIGYANFDEVGLMHVSYLPSRSNWRWGMFEDNIEVLNQLRAEVAQAIENNTLVLESTQGARNLAQKVRVGKAIDPSLGLYAATAFSQASMDDKVSSVMKYMRQDLHADLFDVRLLASRKSEEESDNECCPLVPPCPMLTQNWHVLSAREGQLPMALEKARPYLSNAMWTTFTAEATKDLMLAFKKGELG